MLLSFAQFERDILIERTQEGKAIAKENPNYREGRKKKYSQKQLDYATDLLQEHSYSEVVEITGISKSTIIREVRRKRNKNT